MSWIVLGIILISCGVLALTLGNILLRQWMKRKP